MHRYYILILSLFFCVNLFAHNYVFENISTRNGLSQNHVSSILQDKQGFMWFGTNDGLNCYDGYEFEVYRYSPNTNKGLNSNLIQTIAEDKHQNIWIGSADGGVNMIDFESEKVISPAIFQDQFKILEKENIRGIATIDDLVVVITKEALFFLKDNGGKYEHVEVNGKHFIETGTTITHCFQQISDNEFYIGTKHGLKILRISKGAELRISIIGLLEDLYVYRIAPFREGFLFYCLPNELYFVDKQFALQPIIQEQFNCILVEDDKSFWAGSNSGLHLFKFANDSSLKFSSRTDFDIESTNGELGSNIIQSIYKDKAGIMWLGTAGGGITKLFKRPEKFGLHHHNPKINSLNENSITSFWEDSKKRLWFGTKQRMLAFYSAAKNNDDGNVTEIANSGITSSILDIHEMQYRGKSYIIVTNDYSRNNRVFDLQLNQIEDIPLCKALHRIAHPVNVMVSDEKYLWLGTIEGGLYRYEFAVDKLTHFLNRRNPSLCSNLINALCLDSENTLWIGTDKGLNALLPEERDKANPSFVRYVHNEDDAKSISYNYVTCILERNEQELWLGTLGGGLNHFNPYTGVFSRFTTDDGLSSNSVKGIVADDNNQLWISSNHGLSCLNFQSSEITNYSPSDGLQDYEFNERSAFKRESGQIMFGGVNGFNSFFPQQIKRDKRMPELVFTGLDLVSPSNDKEVHYNRARLASQGGNVSALHFKHNEKSFTAHFSALNFFAPNEVEYKYRLSGFEETWWSVDAKTRFAKYTNLPAGDYTLEVLATNSDGVWTNNPLQLKIKIAKAWYNTGLAYFSYALLIVLAFVFFNRFSIIKNNIKNDLLMQRFEKEKVEQLTQLKLRFFTNVSHELRTPIAIIKSYFENIAPSMQKQYGDKVNNDLNVISRNINSLSRLVNQLLDFRKLEQDKMLLIPAENDMAQLLEDSLASFRIWAGNKNISLVFKNKCKPLRFYFDEDKMNIIINNLLTNALKYTPDGGRIEVRLSELPKEVKIEIEDSGIGIPLNVQNRIFERFVQVNLLKKNSESTGIGLSLTKGLIDLHKGRIEMESSEGRGTCFSLYFKKGVSHLKEFELIESQSSLSNLTELVKKEEEVAPEKELSTVEYRDRTILIVEDNADLLSYLADKMAEHFNVLTADNGKAGLEKCAEQTPDLVISDVMMPEMNGYELCNAIKNDDRICHIPIILLTAKANYESELLGFKMGADAYVGKPFNLDVIIAQIVAIFYSRQQMWKRIGDNPFFNPSEVTFNAKDEEFLRTTTETIEKYISNTDFSVEQLAQHFGVTKNNLNTKIKALTGKTTIKYIRFLRLRRAAQLLQDKDSRVSEVTYEVGYTDLQHFRIHFKKEFSLTPSEYKETHCKKS